MPEYIEKFNVVTSVTTNYSPDFAISGYLYKETTYPFVGLVYIVVVASVFIVINNFLKK